jgi:hypothetical protein
MWLFWLLVIGVAVWWYLSKREKSSSSRVEAPAIKFTITSDIPKYEEVTVGVKETSDGGFILGQDSPFPITLHGITREDADEIVATLDMGSDYSRYEKFIQLAARKNIRCKELEAWISESKAQVRDYVKAHILANEEWKTASKLDKQDILQQIQLEAVNQLDTRPADIDAAITLLLDEPTDITADDALLEKFKDSPDTFKSLLGILDFGTKVKKYSSDDYYRKAFEELHKQGLMRRGSEIPMEDILASMTMKQMQEIAGSDAPKKFTRKAHAIEILMALPDLQDRLGKVMSFRELFQLKPIDGLDMNTVAKSFAYSTAAAKTIHRTLSHSHKSQSMRVNEPGQEEVYEWHLESEYCCPSCKKKHGTKWKRRPSQLPPYHVGCDAWIAKDYVGD